MSQEKALVLLSGGMDSATALAQAVQTYKQVETISFYYGSKHNDREYEHAVLLCHHYNVTNVRLGLNFINSSFKSDLLISGGEIPEGHYAHPTMKKTVVPFRNGIMLAIAVGFAESNEIQDVIIANHVGDHAIYPDCTPAFIKPFAEAAKNGTYSQVSVVDIFGDIDKTGIAKRGDELGVPWEKTWSCYKGLDIHCGVCGTCVERKEAFRDSGLTDPTVYARG